MLVSNELTKLGFRQAAEGQQPKLLVGMKYLTIDHPVREVREDPFMGGPYFGGPYWGPGYGRFGYSRYSRYSRFGYSPFFYDPFGYGSISVQERIRHEYQRQLRVTINAATGTKLYDVTVQNTSRVQETPYVMPALVQSAFTGFPGPNGVPRRVDLKIEPNTEVIAPAQATTASGH